MEPQSPPRGPTNRKPSMGPTRPAPLVLAVLLSVAAGWFLASAFYRSIPPLPWTPAAVLLALALLEGYLAINTRARIQRKPGHLPVDPLAVARYVVLAKASSLVGAIFGGFSGAFVVYLALLGSDAAQRDLLPAIGGLVGGIALVIAGLLLERACRVPKPPKEEEEKDAHRNQG